MDEIVSVELRGGVVFITTKLWVYCLQIDRDGLPMIERVGPTDPNGDRS